MNRDAWQQFVTDLVTDGWASPNYDPADANARFAAAAAFAEWRVAQGYDD